MLDCVIRKTYGFNKKRDQISLSQFVLSTGLDKPDIIRAHKKLAQMNLISIGEKANEKPKTYMFNKNFDTWKPLAKKPITRKSLAKKPTRVGKKANPSLAKKPTLRITKDNTTKDTITKDTGTEHYFRDKDFQILWSAWLEVRKEKKIPNTVMAMKLALGRLAKWGLPAAKVSLANAIEKGYRGVFEPKLSDMPPRRKDQAQARPAQRPVITPQDAALVRKCVKEFTDSLPAQKGVA